MLATMDNPAAVERARSESLRVLLVSSSSGSQGGGELYLVGLAEGLRAAGHEVHAALATHERMDELAELLSAHAVVHRVPIVNTYDRRLRVVGSLMDVGGARTLVALVRRVAPDVVHLNKQNLEDGLDLLKVLDSLSCPLVTTIHVTRSARSLGARGAAIRDWLSTRVLKRIRSPVLATASACRDELAFRRQKHVHLVLNGVRDCDGSARRSLRRAWSCSDASVVLGVVARIEDQKNPLFVADCLARMERQVRCVWIGDGRLRQSLEERIRHRGIEDRILIEGWRSDARERLAGFDMFVLPSRYEGFPFSLLEAMSAGLACVASDVDGIADAIEDGVTGRLCRAGDEEQWVRVLSELIANPEERARLGAAARRRWQERFSLESMSRGTVAVYREAIAQHSAGACCRGIA
jgi:glycosyltransferase involved in cell wall biosynthesis